MITNYALEPGIPAAVSPEADDLLDVALGRQIPVELLAPAHPNNTADWERIQALRALGFRNSSASLASMHRAAREPEAAYEASKLGDYWGSVARLHFARSIGLTVPMSGDHPLELVRKYEQFKSEFGGTGDEAQAHRHEEAAWLGQCIRARTNIDDVHVVW